MTSRLGALPPRGTPAHRSTAPLPGRRRRGLATVAALAAGGLVLAGCSGGDGGSQQQSDGPITLTFVNAQDPGTFDAVIESFERDHPDITIEQQVVPFDDLNSTVQSRLSSKDPTIDLYDVDAPRLTSFAARGYLEPLDDLREDADGTVDAKALDALTYEDSQYAMPRWTSTQLLFFNRGLLGAAGVAEPSSDPASPVTWEEIATNGAAAQQAGATWGMTFDQVGRYYQLQPLPEQLGGGSGLSGDDMLTPDVTNDAWVDAFTWYGETFESGLAPRGVPPEQTPSLFAAGSSAYFVGGPWNVRSFEESADLDYGVAPFPVFAEGEPASSTGSWATGISPFSDNVDAAKEFLAYMTVDPTGAEESTSNNIPVQRDAQEAYLDDLGSEGEVFGQMATIIQHELAENAVARPSSIGYVEFETTMNKAFDDIANGSDPAERLAEASDELDRALSRYQD